MLMKIDAETLLIVMFVITLTTLLATAVSLFLFHGTSIKLRKKHNPERLLLNKGQ